MKELVSTIHEINQVANYSLNQDDWSFSTSRFKGLFMLRSVLKKAISSLSKTLQLFAHRKEMLTYCMILLVRHL